MNISLITTLAQFSPYYGDEYGYATSAGGSMYGTATFIGLALLVITGIIGMVVQSRLKSVMKQYTETPAPLSGEETAQLMLRQNGIQDVRVTHTGGSLTDHFNPMDKTVNLSDTVYAQHSVAAMAVAAHECGHALQHAQGYAWIGLRSSLVPVVNIGSRLGQIVLIMGLILVGAGSGTTVAWIGLALFGTTTLFALVTLPVEFDASRRALAWLESSGLADRAMHGQASTALRWAAMTYVAAALSSIAMLVYYALIILSRSSDRRG